MKPMGEGNFECSNCNSVEKGDLVARENIKQKEQPKKGVVDDKNIFADYNSICKKCGYDKAQVIERQPYISDEDSLTFLKCGKCGYTVQLARKIG